MSVIQMLDAIAEKLNITVQVDVEFCTAKNCAGVCIRQGDTLIIKLASLKDERVYAHELVHAFQYCTSDYFWEEDDLEFWGLLEDVPLDETYMNGFPPYWEAIVHRKMYAAEKRRWEYLPMYIQHATNGMQVFWRIAKGVLASR
jgi:hypothetical protein